MYHIHKKGYLNCKLVRMNLFEESSDAGGVNLDFPWFMDRR